MERVSVAKAVSARAISGLSRHCRYVLLPAHQYSDIQRKNHNDEWCDQPVAWQRRVRHLSVRRQPHRGHAVDLPDLAHWWPGRITYALDGDAEEGECERATLACMRHCIGLHVLRRAVVDLPASAPDQPHQCMGQARVDACITHPHQCMGQVRVDACITHPHQCMGQARVDGKHAQTMWQRGQQIRRSRSRLKHTSQCLVNSSISSSCCKDASHAIIHSHSPFNRHFSPPTRHAST